MIPRPQDTGCTTIEVCNEGTTNGIVSMIADLRNVEYDEEADVYRVGRPK